MVPSASRTARSKNSPSCFQTVQAGLADRLREASTPVAHSRSGGRKSPAVVGSGMACAQGVEVRLVAAPAFHGPLDAGVPPARTL